MREGPILAKTLRLPGPGLLGTLRDHPQPFWQLGFLPTAKPNWDWSSERYRNRQHFCNDKSKLVAAQ